jgi:hypothetical protein
MLPGGTEDWHMTVRARIPQILLPVFVAILAIWADIAMAASPSPLGQKRCFVQPFHGEATQTVDVTGVHSSIGTAIFPDGLSIGVDYHYRSLMGEPLRKFIASVGIPKSLHFDIDDNGPSDIAIIYDPELGPGEVSYRRAKSANKVDVFRAGRGVFEGIQVSQAMIRPIPKRIGLRPLMFAISFPGTFGKPGGTGWDIEGAPGWDKIFGADPNLSGEKAAARNRDTWCQLRESSGFHKFEFTDVKVSVETLIARMRKLSPEFGEVVRRRKGSLLSAILAGVENSGVDTRAKQLVARAVQQVSGRLQPNDREQIESAIQKRAMASRNAEIVGIGGQIVAALPDDPEAKPDFDLKLVRRALAEREALEGASGYGADLHDYATRIHRLTMIGRLPPLDLILLVDRSSSMSDVFEALKREVSALVGDIDTLSPSAHIAMVAYSGSGRRRFDSRRTDDAGLKAFAKYLDGLGTSGGDAAFSNILADYVQVSPFRPQAQARVILIFGDIPDNGSGARFAARLDEAFPGTAVIPVWTGDETIPENLEAIARTTGNRVVTFDGNRGNIRSVILNALGLEEFRDAKADE